jgi:hypothetical protein
VETAVFTPVFLPMAVIAAPGMAAPWAFVTMPMMAAWLDCAEAGTRAQRNSATTVIRAQMFFIETPHASLSDFEYTPVLFPWSTHFC